MSIDAMSLTVFALWFAHVLLFLSYRNASNLKLRRTKSTLPRIAWPTYWGWWINRLPRSHIRELDTRWSDRRSGGSLLEQVFDRCKFIRCDWKTFDSFLRFCIHAWFSNDFLQPRCFPRDLYAVNNAGNVRECLPPFPAPSSSLSCLRMRRDREKFVPRVPRSGAVFAKPPCEFAVMQLPLVIPAWSHRRRRVTRVFRNLFKFLPQHVLHGRMISVLTSSHHWKSRIVNNKNTRSTRSISIECD